MIELNVDLGERSYPIFIGENLLTQVDCFKPYIAGDKVMIVSNETVAPLYADRVKQTLSDYQVDMVVLPDGEQYKNLGTLNLIFDGLLERRHSRKTTIVALGGGVVGDMAGFAASCYQRGVDFIQVPTTLLSQVDSSVGGKTAVNHPLGKNMIGAFYQPKAVVIDTSTLKTLPEREVSAGLAEVIKYGLIRDVAFLEWLELNMERLRALDTEALTHAIRESCLCKARVVEEDELEGGVRALLNLGHTFGHAIESHSGYGNWLHGEAVGAGMVMAAHLSLLEGDIDQADFDRAQQLILNAGLPVKGPEAMTETDYMDLMSVDKKVIDGAIRFVLLNALGDARVTDQYQASNLSQVLA